MPNKKTSHVNDDEMMLDDMDTEEIDLEGQAERGGRAVTPPQETKGAPSPGRPSPSTGNPPKSRKRK